MTRFHTLMRVFSYGAISLFACSAAIAAQQPSVVVKGDNITIRGCVGRVPPANFGSQPFVIWSRSDVMLKNVSAIPTGQATPLSERVFYWLNNDKDIAKHVGQLVEVKGELGDFKTGQVKFDKDGDFTEIKLTLGGKTDKARVPTAWLGATSDGKLTFPVRKIDVDNVKVLSACPAQ